ncbi:hypothetical protein JK208_03785 [Gluconobacter sp. Dm-74]|uniref:hypothetical protein n=1 Tax=Gluconobacter sp. Dm-74 TaxID=2799803 RepID=UPI001B8C5DF1|nr:hypothetical protein [Gluconobacter sp. Dm-74]MBS1090733.1 hypothetical protein [Gluconobacter sp. Dm-74]
MASAIGLRGYLITVHKKGESGRLPFNSKEFNVAPRQFWKKFVIRHNTVVQDVEKERSWYFQEIEQDGRGNSKGYTHYGTYGFESNFVDNKTQVRNYRRKVDDIEEIPLFYEIWLPKDKDFSFVAFQSFQGRSCIGLVMDQAKIDFAHANPGYILKYQKLLPSEGSSLYSKEPVRRLRLIKRNAPSDLADSYLGGNAPDQVDFEVRLSAKRNKTLGLFSAVTRGLKKSESGLVLHEGIEFSEAYAEVKIGGKYRPVGIFGSDSNAGVIDITESINRGRDGHPTYDSISQQSDEILSDFFNIMEKTKK